ncbi:MAG: hypothetical protein ACI861_000348 [Paracoccaceae bacterium]
MVLGRFSGMKKWQVSILVVLAALVVSQYALSIKPTSFPSNTSNSGSTRKPVITKTNWDIKVTKAISGNKIIIKNRTMSLKGLSCASPSTEQGRDAKALLNTFLRAGYVECTMYSSSGGSWSGHCIVNGKDVATGMKQSGLCK